jgi:undecaprenyl-diphosphatase
MSYLQAIVIGLLQGVTELFPVSSLGHSILIPALIGGDWAKTLDISAEGSPYLAFLVAVHVATAVALVVFFRRDWARIITGLYTSIRYRRVDTADQRLAWLLIIATIPVGLAGVTLEHLFRTVFGKPVPAALFLTVNGVILYVVERLRARRANTAVTHPAPTPVGPARSRGAARTQVYASTHHTDSHHTDHNDQRQDPGHSEALAMASDRRLSALSRTAAIGIGAAQILALLPGISRSGSTMAAGLLRGLDHEDAARFAFLLATPVIAAAAVLKLPELAGPAGHGILGQVAVGSLVAGVAAFLSLRFLTHYFETRTLTPFAIYCTAAGLTSLVWLTFA